MTLQIYLKRTSLKMKQVYFIKLENEKNIFNALGTKWKIKHILIE